MIYLTKKNDAAYSSSGPTRYDYCRAKDKSVWTYLIYKGTLKYGFISCPNQSLVSTFQSEIFHLNGEIEIDIFIPKRYRIWTNSLTHLLFSLWLLKIFLLTVCQLNDKQDRVASVQLLAIQPAHSIHQKGSLWNVFFMTDKHWQTGKGFF